MPNTKPFKESVIKLVLPFLLLVVLVFALVFFIILPMAEEHAVDNRKENLESLSMTALSILFYYHNLEQENACSLKVAQESAKKNIRQLRYGKNKKNYFWIVDVRGVVQVHPYRPDYEGLNQLSSQDARGKHFIKEFVDTAVKNGEGFVDYKWQKYDDPNEISNKLSHVRIFSPWGWVIGTGAYKDDIDVDLTAFALTIIFSVIFIILFVGIIYSFILKNFISTENKKRSSFEKLLMQEAKIRALLEATPDMILRIDREGKVLDYKEPIGFEPFVNPVEILDKKIIDTWNREVAEKVIKSIERVFVTKGPQKLIFEYPSDKETITIEAHFSMCDENEILATFRDISKRNT